MRRLPRQRRAFTVLEILIAVTVFAVISLVIFALFRTAIQAQNTADRETRLIQQARFALDTIGKDVTNIFFREETSYNVAIARQIEEMESARLQAEADNNWDAFYAMYGNPDEDDEDAENPTVGDPYTKGRIIDLQMQGDASTLSFAVRSPLAIGGYYRPWGLARVEYALRNGLLVRVATTVETDSRDQMGEVTTVKRIPELARVAEDVVELEFGYCFWYDNQWYEVKTWNSANRQIRNPRYLIGTYEDENTQQITGGGAEQGENQEGSFGPGSPGFNESLNDNQSEPLDRLPAAIRVRLKVGDKDNPTRAHTFESLYRVPGAIETWSPLPEMDEEMREEEQALRDETYVIVYPGTTEPLN